MLLFFLVVAAFVAPLISAQITCAPTLEAVVPQKENFFPLKIVSLKWSDRLLPLRQYLYIGTFLLVPPTRLYWRRWLNIHDCHSEQRQALFFHKSKPWATLPIYWVYCHLSRCYSGHTYRSGGICISL